MCDAEAPYERMSYLTTAEPVPNWMMFRAIATAMLGAIMFGLDQGNFGNVQSFVDFQREWCIDRFGDELTCTNLAGENSSWQDNFLLWGASLITIGAAVGGLAIGPVLAHDYGRRPCISIGSATCFAGCALASYLSYGIISVFMIGRFMTGFGIGISCFALPLYNSEISTPSLRGSTGSLFQLNVVIGSFIATLVTLLNSDWRFGMLLPGLAGGVVSIAIWFVPESPRYVMLHEGYKAGLTVLQQVRSGTTSVDMEAEEMYTQIIIEKDSSQVSYVDLFFLPSLRKRVFIACWLQVAQQLTGVNSFLGYASTLFKDVGVDQPLLFNVIWNSIMVLGCVMGLLLIDSSYGGRRSQLLGATFLMGPSLIIAGFCLVYSLAGIIIMVMVCIYGIGFQLAWGSVPWIYPSEIFSMTEREKAVSVAVFLQYAANAVVIIFTPSMMTISPSGTIFTFGGLNILNLLFVMTFIKETKGVALEDIGELFAPGISKVAPGISKADSTGVISKQTPSKWNTVDEALCEVVEDAAVSVTSDEQKCPSAESPLSPDSRTPLVPAWD